MRNMGYDVEITKPAYKDLEDIYAYISENLDSPITAHKVISDINKALLSLSDFPERYPIIDIRSLKSKNLRKMHIKSYIVLYYVRNNKVTISRIFYGKRDIEAEINRI